MTEIQIYALIGLILTAGLLFWSGYMVGRSDGLTAGIEDGKDTQRADSAKTIRELEASLQFIRADHTHLAQVCKKLKGSQTFGPIERHTLLSIAEKLNLAAATFQAVTSKSQAQQALDLRERALNMAALLEPATQERAA